MARLDDRAVLSIRGRDSEKLLQGLVTSDLAKLGQGQACYSALLTPQGKIISDFVIYRLQDGFFLDIAKDISAEVAKKLNLYKLRADAVVEDQSEDYAVVATWNRSSTDASVPPNAIISVVDPRLDALGYRALVMRGKEPLLEAQTRGAELVPCEAYHRHRIQLGVPEAGKDYPFSSAFPHDACLDLLKAVSFSKGCYVGQEVVSRMRHKGGVRKRCLKIEADDTPLPIPGADVKAGAAVLGQLGSSAGQTGLAILRIDRLAEMTENNVPLTIEGKPVRAIAPDWADFSA